jgi:hypothetical protein
MVKAATNAGRGSVQIDAKRIGTCGRYRDACCSAADMKYLSWTIQRNVIVEFNQERYSVTIKTNSIRNPQNVGSLLIYKLIPYKTYTLIFRAGFIYTKLKSTINSCHRLLAAALQDCRKPLAAEDSVK